MNMFKRNASLLEHGNGIGAVVVSALCNYAQYTAVDYQHRAGAAGRHLAIQRRSVYCDSPLCCLADRILFSVYGPDAVLGNRPVLVLHFFELMPDFIAVGEPHRTSDVAGYQNLVVECNNAPGSAAVAGCSFGNGSAHFHKIFVPGWPDVSLAALCIHTGTILARRPFAGNNRLSESRKNHARISHP